MDKADEKTNMSGSNHSFPSANRRTRPLRGSAPGEVGEEFRTLRGRGSGAGKRFLTTALLAGLGLSLQVQLSAGEQAPPGLGASQAPVARQDIRKTDPTRLSILMMEEVRRRQEELAAREEAIRLKEEKLKDLEKELLETLDRLDKRRQELMALEKRLTEQEERRILQLAKVFEAAPPEEGGRLLSGLEPNIAARLLERMNSRKAGRLWGFVDPNQAAAISKILTTRQKK